MSKEEGNLKGDGIGEEDANEEGADASDDEETTSIDEDWSTLALVFLCFVFFVGYALDVYSFSSALGL